MPCTTLLVGKKATYDGSTMIARTEDSGAGGFMPKKFSVVLPEEQAKTYQSVISHCEIRLPDHPLRYTCMENGIDGEGIWAAAGANSANVAMSATETLTSNPRVLAADPLVKRIPAKGTEGEEGFAPEVPGGIGEEDIVTIVLPYINSAREGVQRLGMLLEEYGTYEMNGIAFSDQEEIWWLETIGGHHWIAKRVPDECYVTMPNQLGIDYFDMDDAFGEQKEHLCSSDLREFVAENHLDLSLDGGFNPRLAFGSHSDSDHVYNTPRAWVMQRHLNPRSNYWDGPEADFTPMSDDIPWCREPEYKLTVEDVKEVLSLHYQGTPFDPYARHGEESWKNAYRPVGISRTNHTALLQIRPYMPEANRVVKWIGYASNVYNSFVPMFTNVNVVPEYLANTTGRVSTENSYWMNRLVGALADPHHSVCIPHIERYQMSVMAQGHARIAEADRQISAGGLSEEEVRTALEKANAEIAEMLKRESDALLDKVLFDSSNRMRNAYSRSDG